MKIFLTIIFSFLLTTLFAQGNWRKGYLVQTGGDTLQVEIQDGLGWTSSKLLYRIGSDGFVKEAFPGDVRGFGVHHGRVFEAVRSTPVSEEARFYEMIVIGKADLLVMDNRFLVRMNDTAYYEMKGGSRQDIQQGKTVTRETYPFRGMLNFLFNDCNKVKNDILTATLNEDNLRNLVETYNSCFGGSKKLAKKSATVISINLFVGWTSQNITYSATSKAQNYMAYAKPTATGVSFGSAVRLTIGKSSEIALGFTYFNANVDFKTDVPELQEQNTVSLKSSNLQADLTYQYSFRNTGLIPYMFVGPSFGFTLSESSSRERIFAGNAITNFSDFIKTDFLLGVGGGLGVRLNADPKITPYIEVKFTSVFGDIKVEPTTLTTVRNGLYASAGISIRL